MGYKHSDSFLTTLIFGDMPQMAVWSPDGSHVLITGTAQPIAKVLDAATGDEIVLFDQHMDDPPSPFADTRLQGSWSPDGTRIVTFGPSGMLRVWDSSSGDELLTIPNSITGGAEVAWSPDGTYILGCDDIGPQLWDVDTGKAQFINKREETNCNGVDWSPDSTRFVTAGWEGLAIVWDAQTGEALLTFEEHDGPVLRARWSPVSNRIISGDDSGIVKLWNPDTAKVYFSHQFSENYIWELSWSPDGKQFAIVDYTPVTTVWAAWNSVDELIAYAKECCVLRDLTPEERELFGLPPTEEQPSETESSRNPVMPYAASFAALGLASVGLGVVSRRLKH